jgi:predicted glycosyl hydrolase (DUF1957 family)
MTTYWALLLHIYQPPTQDHNVLKKIDKECYKPLFSLLNNYDNVKLCLNINGILIELFYEYDLSDTMDLLKNLVYENKIEIVGTAKFHPILPLIPNKEIKRQIEMNEKLYRKEFEHWERKGFFPPELAISEGVVTQIRNLGYKWIIASGIACPIEWPYDIIYTSPNGLQLFFRDDIFSNKIAFNDITAKNFIKEVKNLHKNKEKSNKTYFITALDGETFGHHIKGYEKTFLGKCFELINEDNKIKMTFISDLENFFPIAKKKKIVPKESSWSTTYDDLKTNIPFSLWKHPNNNIHKYYWKLMKSLNNIMDLLETQDLKQNRETNNYYQTSRWFYDRGLYSCPTWWSNPLNQTWSPNLIYKGVELLMKAALNAQLALVCIGKSDLSESYFDSISYYHGLLFMELNNITKRTIEKFEMDKDK